MSVRPVFALIAATVLALAVTGVAGAQDRYGPPLPPNADPTPVGAAPTTYLSWPGKAGPAAAQTRPLARYQIRTRPEEPLPPALAAVARPASAHPLPTSIYAPPPPALRPAVGAAPDRYAPQPVRYAPRPAHQTAPRPAPPRPVSPQAAAAQPAPAAQPAQQASASDAAPPRFYSLHREYGVTPDPIPLAGQFFADSSTGDLAGPPPPPPPHLVAGQSATSATNSQRAQAAADIAADPDAPPSN